MEKFITHKGIAAPLDLPNADTDQIIPKQFLKRVERKGYGRFLFFHHRYLENGEPNPEFILNQEPFNKASILLGRENFGGGSSREHAAWAIKDFGLRAVIAPGFADIFKNNSFNNGILLIEQDPSTMDEWFKRALGQKDYQIEINLENQTLKGSDGFKSVFEIDKSRKKRLLEGLDNIGLTLAYEKSITNYEKAHEKPWQAFASCS